MFFWEDTSKRTEEIAQELLGCLLVKESPEGVTSGFIVETEAYLGEIDMAAHSYQRRKTPRLEAMYQKAGTIYVYSMHMQQLVNLVVQEPGVPEAILIRAVEPYDGISLMESRRGKNGIELTNGPGKMTIAMGIDKTDNGGLISAPPLYIEKGMKKKPQTIKISERIGIPNKGEWTSALLRYSVKGNPYVSKSRKSEALEDYGWSD